MSVAEQDEALPAEPSHGASCSCVRCTGFQPGHDLSRRHGAYSALTRPADVEELRLAIELVQEELETVGLGAHHASGLVRSLAMVIVRKEYAWLAIQRVDAHFADGLDQYLPANVAKLGLADLRADLRAWKRLELEMRRELGLSPRALAAVGRDVELAREASDRRLRTHLEQRYGNDNGGGGS